MPFHGMPFQNSAKFSYLISIFIQTIASASILSDSMSFNRLARPRSERVSKRPGFKRKHLTLGSVDRSNEFHQGGESFEVPCFALKILIHLNFVTVDEIRAQIKRDRNSPKSDPFCHGGCEDIIPSGFSTGWWTLAVQIFIPPSMSPHLTCDAQCSWSWMIRKYNASMRASDIWGRKKGSGTWLDELVDVGFPLWDHFFWFKGSILQCYG